MAIYRAPLATKHFTQVPNHWLRDPDLTGKAKGYLAYIASHAAGYELTVKQMVAEMKDGESAVKAGLRELETAGYLRRRQRRNPDGTLAGTDYWIVESPSDDATVGRFSADGESASGETADGSSADGKPGTKNTRAKNTTTKNTTETDQTCTTSDRFAHSGGGEDSHFAADDTEPDDNSSWRAEDRAAFRQLIGDKIRSTGVNDWNTGIFDTDAVYDALRQRARGRKPMKWPGRYLRKLVKDDNEAGLVNWLDDQGFELL